MLSAYVIKLDLLWKHFLILWASKFSVCHSMKHLIGFQLKTFAPTRAIFMFFHASQHQKTKALHGLFCVKYVPTPEKRAWRVWWGSKASRQKRSRNERKEIEERNFIKHKTFAM